MVDRLGKLESSDMPDTFKSLRKSMLSCLASDSGAMYSSLVTPEERSCLTSTICLLLSEEFQTCAMPLFRIVFNGNRRENTTKASFQNAIRMTSGLDPSCCCDACSGGPARRAARPRPSALAQAQWAQWPLWEPWAP